jgi:hypothetical protein
MKTESESRVERDLEVLAAQSRVRGQVLDPRALARARAELERRHRQFPLVPVLAALLALACAAGVWLGVARPRDELAPGPHAVARLGAVTAAALALVALLRWLE